MATNLRKTIEYVGLDYKKEMSKIALINVGLLIITALLIFFTRIILVGAIAIFSFAFIDYFLFTSYSSKKKAITKDHSVEFIYIISYFRIFLENKNNVYQSFNKLFDYSSNWLKEKLEIFLKAIDADKSVKPFTDFASQFDLPIARNILVSIYQMVEQGETGDQLNHFTVLFEQMNKALNDERKDKKNKSFDFVMMFPIIGASITTIALTFGILSAMEGMLNVF